MVKFECNLCGKCCQSFGEFIKIERQISDRDYFCRYGITNELFPVHVLPEFAEEIDDEFTNTDTTESGSSRKGCIFLRKNPDGKGFVCAVYPTRPSVCKAFLCYRMLIYHKPSGELRGKIIGTNELTTQDEILAGLWKEKIVPILHPNASQHAMDDEWVANVVTILASHGYRAEKVE